MYTVTADFKNGTLADYSNDWAILKLNKPIGKKYCYLGWKSLPSSGLVGDTKKFALVGYSGDFPNPKKKGYENLSAGESITNCWRSPGMQYPPICCITTVILITVLLEVQLSVI
ncbi:hypothetical protein ACEYW6_22840 [Nostoc sp. UIC 10607]|uniref:hypothetical protein n=1 Tax=Nostoc sp. UIC 10607 TaxID=3045935 RepID=UPI0039A356AE